VKKRIALSIIICLIFTLSTACGIVTENNEAKGSETSATSKTSGSGIPTSAMVEQKNPIVIMCNEHAQQAIIIDAPAHIELQKRTGVKFDLKPIPSADYDAKVQTLLSTNNMPDVLKVTYTQLRDYAPTGMFLNLSEKMDVLPNYKAVIDKVEQTKFMTVEGDFYFFLTIMRYAYLNGNFPLIREDMLAKTGKSVPTSFDELYDVLLAFKKYNPSSIPWGTRGGADHICDRVGYAFGVGPNDVYFDPDVDGGRYVYNPINPNFKEFLAYLNKCYANGILDPDYTVTASQQWQENLSSNKSYFYFDNGSFVDNFNKQLQKSDPTQKFIPIKTLKNQFGQTRNRIYPGSILSEQGWAISADCKEIDAALRLYDYMYSEEGADLTNYGIEGEHFTKEGDKYTINPTLVAYHKENDNDPWRAWQSKLGIGLLDMAVYCDTMNQFPFLSEEAVSYFTFWTNDKALHPYHFLPPLRKEEIEEVKQIKSALTTITTSELDKFIMGIRPIGEYDAFRQDLINAGAKRLEEIYEEAAKRLK